jgi:hypothetical protein
MMFPHNITTAEVGNQTIFLRTISKIVTDAMLSVHARMVHLKTLPPKIS